MVKAIFDAHVNLVSDLVRKDRLSSPWFGEATAVRELTWQVGRLYGGWWVAWEGLDRCIEGDTVRSSARMFSIACASHGTIRIGGSLGGTVLQRVSAIALLSILHTSKRESLSLARGNTSGGRIGGTRSDGVSEDTTKLPINIARRIMPRGRQSSGDRTDSPRRWWDSAIIVIQIETVRSTAIERTIPLAGNIAAIVSLLGTSVDYSIPAIAFCGIFHPGVAVPCGVACVHTLLRRVSSGDGCCVTERAHAWIVRPAPLGFPVTVGGEDAGACGTGGGGAAKDGCAAGRGNGCGVMLVDAETIGTAAVVVLISITEHIAPPIGSHLWRDGVTAIAFLSILETSKGVTVGVACIYAELDCHC